MLPSVDTRVTNVCSLNKIFINLGKHGWSRSVEGFESIRLLFFSNCYLTLWFPPTQDKPFAKYLVCCETYHRYVVGYDHVVFGCLCTDIVDVVDSFVVNDEE
jgi:hypothetical protein